MLKHYDNSNEEDNNLAQMLDFALRKVRRRVLEKAQEYVPVLPGVPINL